VKACVRVGSVVGGRNVGQSACRDAGSMRVCVCVYVCVVFVGICCLRGMLVARNVIFGDRSEQIAVVSQRGER
jgi:hypothetical protein